MNVLSALQIFVMNDSFSQEGNNVTFHLVGRESDNSVAFTNEESFTKT